ncbi:uncharacterized protein UTRI_03404_B [Ustilago trichophora]|uniref:Homeobox domain-containing protein n=1 Tax=Ustilago trichophora TaxID=86804 RepID=A0A5C3E3N1_9BASI|nr:uncharacterized protein UTRI_03404_B [Ustilago trichophora]
MSSQRPQRAAAVQAIKANAAALAPRRRSDSQASNKTITSPHIKSEERRYDGRSSPSMDVMMQRSSHQDLRRTDSMGGSAVMPATARDDMGSNYNPNVFPMYWPGQEDPSGMGSAPPPSTQQAGAGSGYHQQQFWEDPIPEQHSLSYHDHVPSHASFDPHYSYPGHQSNLLGLKEDTGLNVGLNGSLDLGDSMHHRDHKPYDGSDGMALLDSLPFKASSSADNDDSYEDSTDSDLPPEKKKLSAAFRPRGRKKRNKCTPDQLRSLEAFFEKNRNPTGRIRLELSRKLRMPERSVQVWFQNRRAKVKTIERRGDTGSDSGRKKSCSIRLSEKDTYRPVGMGGGGSGRGSRDASDQAPSVTAIPTSALCIGTWRRVSPLICFFSRRLQSMTWYLTSESIGFKLEIPWTSIRSAYFDGPSNPSIAERAEGVRVPLGHFVIDLERPPTFFMEVFRSAPVKNGSTEEPKVSWRQCEDFTEDHQAMTVSRHVLNGPYEELRSAVQALARCNDVLQRLIVFRDADQRAAGAIPTGTNSTADNFGLVNGLAVRPNDPFTSPVDASTAFPTTDAYGNTMQMPLQPAAMSSSSSLQKSAAWHSFRTPLRPGAEHPWEFDSPASVSTNLSEASLDSNQRPHALGYSPYGLPSSIEASPRSGLGSSMDLNSLRIDTSGMSGLGGAGNMTSMMGDGGFDGSRASFDGWDGRLGYDMSQTQSQQQSQADGQYALASSGVLEGGAQGSQAMQGAGLDAGFGSITQVQPFDRNGGERQDYSSHSANAQHQSSDLAQPSESHRPTYIGNNTNVTYDHSTSGSNSLLLSRRFSHAEGTSHADYSQDIKPGESEAMMRRQSEDPRLTSSHSSSSATSAAQHLVPPATATARTFDEDEFCGKTPTHRTSFGSSLQISHGAQDNADERTSMNPPPSGYESGDVEDAAHGRTRSNTYRASTHGGRAATLSSTAMQHFSAEIGHQSSEEEGGRRAVSADRESSGEMDARGASESGSDGVHKTDDASEHASPGLLSLSSEDIANRRDLSPGIGETRSSGSEHVQE